MIALFTGDKFGARRLAELNKILTRQLECGFDRFRTARNEIGVVKIARRRARQLFSKLFNGVTGKKTGVGIGQLIDLAMHCRQHIRMRMT